jgi:pimeloyl-ACP methyl ester carboxylesterase
MNFGVVEYWSNDRRFDIFFFNTPILRHSITPASFQNNESSCIYPTLRVKQIYAKLGLTIQGGTVMTDWEMKRVRGDGIGIQLAVREGQGKPVLCVHGLTANCRCWDVVAAGLVPAHTVLAMDLRGRGLSDKPTGGYSLQQHVHDIAFVLDDLGLERVALMGHSLGAYISINFAAQHPARVDKIILVDGGGQLEKKQWDKIDLVIQPSLDRLGQVFPSFEAYVETLKQAPVLQPWSQAIEDYFRYESETVEGGVRSRIVPEHIFEDVQNVHQATPSVYYSQLKCPVLILRATDGILTPDDLVLPEAAVERMISEIAAARRVDVPGTNHYSILFQPNAQRDQAIRKFLEEK